MDPTSPPSQPEGGGARVVDTNPGDSSGPGPYVMSADTLQGDKVINLQGDKLGKIEEIMLDVPNGRIAYAVLSFGGVFGIGDKLFAVPWSALTLDADRECFLLDADEAFLKNAPGFDKDQWPSMADPAFAAQVYSYYKQSPYWE